MTEEMKDILFREEKRLTLSLIELDPIREARTYSIIINSIQSLRSLQFCGIIEPPEERPEPSIEEYSAPVMYSPEDINVFEPVEPAKTYTKEEVRAALATARKDGLNVNELLAEYGVENFSALPAGKYAEVMARIGKS